MNYLSMNCCLRLSIYNIQRGHVSNLKVLVKIGDIIMMIWI